MEPREFHWPISRIYTKIASLMEPVYNEIVRRMEIPLSARSLLEVGGGDGRFAIQVARHTRLTKIVTTDVSADMAVLARKRIIGSGLADRISAEVQDVHKLDYDDNSFDIVVSNFSFHHWRQPSVGLRECTRVVKPGGVVIICDGYDRPSLRELKNAVKKIGGSWLAILALWFGKNDLLRYNRIEEVMKEAGIEWLKVAKEAVLLIIRGAKPTSQ